MSSVRHASTTIDNKHYHHHKHKHNSQSVIWTSPMNVLGNIFLYDVENSLINLRTMREDDFLDLLTFITQLDPCIKRKLQEAKTKLHIL